MCVGGSWDRHTGLLQHTTHYIAAQNVTNVRLMWSVALGTTRYYTLHCSTECNQCKAIVVCSTGLLHDTTHCIAAQNVTPIRLYWSVALGYYKILRTTLRHRM